MQAIDNQFVFESKNLDKSLELETSIEFKNLIDTQQDDLQYYLSPNPANVKRIHHQFAQTNVFKNVLTEPPRPTGFLMKFIFLFHPILLFLFILPSILTFWVLFITGSNSMKPFAYIVFLMTPLVFQLILLIYHSRSCIFLSYGRQAVSRKYNINYGEENRYQLVDLHSQQVIALLDQRVEDEDAMYLYMPISNQVFNMSYYESTFRVNAIGQWKVIFTWKALLSFLVFGVLVTEFILLFVLRSWLFLLF
ncbi:hypothetical protein PPL_09854 [Heterostelium album PN500]|uniref:Transmembrane protein n=1 Tax=Heterostelium pallidum (strain ATCC 26659 / Pp 5 / PN500) TaxID=670386 RepID=D3BP91_HETP5|nr:hypothetical protein PPL_09854 [Heterostelium album PN500]EFA77101.1 hypothetical protein PPL_09854 [Heterostelium album PN500]|eukprot:XP_020429230.1 hypothetical protein PPL_09854 [Heterostelium album PN500]